MFSVGAFDAERDLPIVYCDSYNIRMFGVELLHQFDTKKYRKIAQHLDYQFLDTQYARPLQRDEYSQIDQLDQLMPRRLRYLQPNRPIDMSELRSHHSASYIVQVHKDKSMLARITEVWLINLLSRCCIEARFLEPIKWQISGTIFAANLAMQHGWSINLGGGFHQASQEAGANFCLFSDVMLAIRYIWRKHPLQKFLIIDLDAHQAIGLERDLAKLPEKKRDLIFMLDVFNNSIQPADTEADAAINLRIELGRFTGDSTYLKRLDEALHVAFSEFRPSLVIYIAGQDVLKDDQLGLMNLSDGGLLKRDELVFKHAVEQHRCPIVMLLAGGYLARGVRLLAESIRHLYSLGLIWGGHKSGSRTLTRPRQSPTETVAEEPTGPGLGTKETAKKSHASQTTGRGPVTRKSLDTIGTHPVAAAPDSQGITKLLKSTFNKTLDTMGRLDHPVDAISESISTSGGIHRMRKVVRVGPKAAHVSKLTSLVPHKSAKSTGSQRRRLELTRKTVNEALQAKTIGNKAAKR